MPLQAVLDQSSFEGLDESLKSFYVQNNENQNFYLDVAPDEAEKLAFNLQTKFNNKKTELDKIHGEKRTLAAELDAYKKLGKTADEIKSALEANRPEEVTKLVTDYEAKIKSLQESYAESEGKNKEYAGQLEQQLVSTLQNNVIAKLRNEFDLNETADYVLRDFIRVEKDESGNYAARVYENGSPALVAGQPKQPEQLIKGFVEAKKFQGMFNAGLGQGSGASNRQQGNPATKTLRRAEYDQMAAQNPLKAAQMIKEGYKLID